jgi:vanillate O-demethylase monooxygenase subunit
MKYLNNAWYAAAWSNELHETPIGRTYLDQPVVLFRDSKGVCSALADICPHRFAPLSRGKIKGDAIECPYHGLRFDTAGACVLNPQGNKAIPKRAIVRTYPTFERYGVIWIWMGDRDRADPAIIPDFSVIVDTDNYAVVQGYLQLSINYQLAIDNLLDLSHVEFLHPLIGNADSSSRTRFEMKEEDNSVFAYNYMPDEPLTALNKMMWDTDATICDRRAHMRWDPPGNMLLDAGVTLCGRPNSEGVSTPSAHLLTPATPTSTHYFWAHCRDGKRDDAELSKRIQSAIDATFRTEDEPMMAACQSRMPSLDLLAVKPISLATDAAAIRARLILKRCIDAEDGAGAMRQERAAPETV